MDGADRVSSVLADIDEAVADAHGRDDATERLLNIGTDVLGVTDAYVTRIDRDNRVWTVVLSTSDRFESVGPCDLDATYCRETIDADRLVSTSASEAGWADDTADAVRGHATYLGARIADAGHAVGTVCFVDDEPRQDPFSPEELLLAELIVRRIEAARTRSDQQARIEHLEDFVSLISHDLRNPLTVARGWLETERRSADAEGVDHAMAAIERLEGLVDTGVTLARAADPVSSLEPVSLASVAPARWRAIDPGDATLDVDGDFRFLADSMRLKLVFEPLFRNAIQYGGDGVTVRVGPLEGSSGFSVADDGPGIDDAYRDRVFDAGFSTTGDSHGYGLATVASAVRAHGWSIDVESSASGGARFVITGVLVPREG